ncbi:MAG: hypothetical protein PHO10_11915 [Gemmiger sp.]|nr:hypothetical protein [Gemmiger sp.]
MYFYDCDRGFVPDNGQNDVTDGSVENYDFNWNEETVVDNQVEPPATDIPATT